MENLGFSTSGLCLAFKIFLAFFQFFWPSDVLIIQNHSNLSYFEAILPLKQFLLKIWQSGSVCYVGELIYRTRTIITRSFIFFSTHLFGNYSFIKSS